MFHTYSVIESRASVAGGPSWYSVVLSGLLELYNGEDSVSVVVRNVGDTPVVVEASSSLMGHCIGS